MRSLALWAITLYQQFISPYKGFSCPYRRWTGRRSCSKLGQRAIRRYGIVGGIVLLRQRTRLCGRALERFQAERGYPPLQQRGSCDAPCDLPCDGNTCDLPDCHCGKALRWLDCCDCSCDWPRSKDRSREKARGPLARAGRARP